MVDDSCDSFKRASSGLFPAPLRPPSWLGGSAAARCEFFSNWRATLILLVSSGLRRNRTRKEISAVRYANTLFHALLELIRRTTFDKMVDEDGTDAAARGFNESKAARTIASLSPWRDTSLTPSSATGFHAPSA